MKRFFLSIVIVLFVGCNKSDSNQDIKIKIPQKLDYYERCRLLVLEENTPNQDFEFVKKGNNIDEQVIKYLGNIVTSEKDTLKILNTVHYSGIYEDSRRGNGQVRIYDSNNQLIGFYNLGSALAIPNYISDKELIFKYKNDQCNQTTKISLKDSIPKQIFIQCTKDGGDIYSLEMAK